jgi:hypothetical protein
MMKKARLIKKQQIEERDAHKEPTALKEKVKQRLGAVVEWPIKTKRKDPRKAFAELFAQPQTQ